MSYGNMVTDEDAHAFWFVVTSIAADVLSAAIMLLGRLGATTSRNVTAMLALLVVLAPYILLRGVHVARMAAEQPIFFGLPLLAPLGIAALCAYWLSR